MIGVCQTALLANAAPGGRSDASGDLRRLLSDTEVVALVQFEEESDFVFRVLEMIYPGATHMDRYFSAYKGVSYGMLSPEYRPDLSYPVVPGEKYLLLLRPLERLGRRHLHPGGGFVMPSYACSYRLVDNLYGAVPLFAYQEKSVALRMNAAVPGGSAAKGSDDVFAAYIRGNLTEAYGTAAPAQIVDAIRALVATASKDRSYANFVKTGGGMPNELVRKIEKEVTEGGSLARGVFEPRQPPANASKEPPARSADTSALRKSSLRKIVVASFTVKDATFITALDVLEKSIRKEPGFEDFRFRVERALLDELSQHSAKFNIDVAGLKASEILELLTTGMHVTVSGGNRVAIERL